MTQRAAQADSLDLGASVIPLVDSASGFWSQVHERVQEQLAALDNEVRKNVANVRISQGRTQGKQFCLFSYRTFSIPESDRDPVVCGVTFTPIQDGIKIEADISGEQTGNVIFTVPGKIVVKQSQKILIAAEDFASKLYQSAEAIAVALSPGAA